MKVNGAMIKLVVKELILMPMVLITQVNGEMISNTDMVKKHGLMEQSTLATMLKARNMEMESLNGLMDQIMKGISLTTIFMVKESMNGLMEEDMKVTGRTIKCMVVVTSLGKMVEHMQEITEMTRKKVRELSTGLMEDNTLENGILANNMAEVNILLLKEKQRKENGKMERE